MVVTGGREGWSLGRGVTDVGHGFALGYYLDALGTSSPHIPVLDQCHKYCTNCNWIRSSFIASRFYGRII